MRRRHAIIGGTILAAAALGAGLLVNTGDQQSAEPVNAATTTTIAGQVVAVPGDPIPVGNLPGWRQIFADDFPLNVPTGKFPGPYAPSFRAYGPSHSPYYTDWRDTSKHGIYMPGRVEVKDGVLRKHIATINGLPNVVAIVPKLSTLALNGVLYGRFAVRFRADKLPGYKVAWLLWPDSGNQKRDGEIDLPEMNLDGTTISAFMHKTNQTTGPTQQAAFKRTADLNLWNTAIIEWSPGLVRFILNGTEMGRTTDRVPNTSMHWVLQTETALLPAPIPAATVKGDVQIDWVVAWAYDPNATGPTTTTTSTTLKPTTTSSTTSSTTTIGGP